MTEPSTTAGAPTHDPASEHHVSMVQAPPVSIPGILRRLGPGLIIAGSIVGSGELIGTTKTGAEAGFWLLWLIIIGCVIKVFVQVEFGRFTIGEGRTPLEGLNEVPGPRLIVNWLLWYWVFMFALGVGQLGGIVGGVGQSMALTIPLTGDFKELLEIQDRQTKFDRLMEARRAEQPPLRQAETLGDGPSARTINARREKLVAQVEAEVGPRPEVPSRLSYTYDDIYWSAIITVITAILLVIGRYTLIQNVAAFLVAGFTAVTIFNLAVLQSRPEWAIHWSDILDGLRFRLPPESSQGAPLATAFATFGIIGVAASELIAYPYWCLEKGYARFTGPRDVTAAWSHRAIGWLRVMRWDAWCSMLVYTFATIAFYLLGAAILHRSHLNPAKDQMLYTLLQMFVPVFGSAAAGIFLFGAFAVLYSTFFVATAGNARMAADALGIFGLSRGGPQRHEWWIRVFCGLFPFLSLGIFIVKKDPVGLVLASGLAQSVMLPMLGLAALYFRYRRCDERIRPGSLWDLFLWVSVVGLLIAGVWGAWENLIKL